MSFEANVYNAQGRLNRLSVLCIDAYGVAVKNGFEGTAEEWLESLKGKSAYEYAKDGGYTGTEEEFSAMLVAPKDTPGEMVVTISPDENYENYTADKTFDEIVSAYDSGMKIRAELRDPYSVAYLPLVYFEHDQQITFACVTGIGVDDYTMLKDNSIENTWVGFGTDE